MLSKNKITIHSLFGIYEFFVSLDVLTKTVLIVKNVYGLDLHKDSVFMRILKDIGNK